MSDEIPVNFQMNSPLDNSFGLRHSIEELIVCKICLGSLKQPKSLPCLHTFCCDCLRTFLTNYEAQRRFPCPVCRKMTVFPRDGVTGFPDSFFISTLDDLLKNDGERRHSLKMNLSCSICTEGGENSYLLKVLFWDKCS